MGEDPGRPVAAPEGSAAQAEGLAADAARFAAARHEGQVRRDGRTPYVVHPARVAALLREHGAADEDLQCAAYLHDVVEDTLRPGETAEGVLLDIGRWFGAEVADLVAQLTKAPAGQESRREYDWSFRHKTPGACVVKLADRLDNLRDWQGMDASFRRPYLAETLDLLAAVGMNGQVVGSPHAGAIAGLATQLRAICHAEGVTRGRHPAARQARHARTGHATGRGPGPVGGPAAEPRERGEAPASR